MPLLLDTHIFMWLLLEPRRLTKSERRRLDEMPASEINVSFVSLWEITIKHASGKLPLPNDFFARLRHINSPLLPHRLEHVEAYARLPMISGHTDPFDRMLIAQAKVEGLTLMTRDKEFAVYGVPLLYEGSA